MCGGTRDGPAGDAGGLGLSPRVRGNLPAVVGENLCAGSIPACAGEPPRAQPFAYQITVYPRVCGGTVPQRRKQGPWRGLSPRVRGNPGDRDGVRPGAGSIPACAGEPPPRHPTAGRRRVYPRVCGGTQSGHFNKYGKWGLSPRVRGNPVGRVGCGHRRWSIPACAGEPPSCGASGLLDTVYPRVCGGTDNPTCPGRTSLGLSPRVRGNRTGASCSVPLQGSIPACAGEPG